jgi:hypothetical protein
LLHGEQCIDGSVTSKLELHLQQTLSLLCPKPYKHPKTTKLNLNTTKEESDGNKLPSPSLLKQHHVVLFFFFLNIEKKAMTTHCHSLLLF